MKHIDIAKAWLDGERVQVKVIDCEYWTDLRKATDLQECYQFHDNFEYRIAPEKKKLRVWEAVNGTLFVSTPILTNIETSSIFKRWVTEEIEYEV